MYQIIRRASLDFPSDKLLRLPTLGLRRSIPIVLIHYRPSISNNWTEITSIHIDGDGRSVKLVELW